MFLVSNSGIVNHNLKDYQGVASKWPPNTGTLESQFLLARGMLQAYAAYNKQQYLDYAITLVKSAIVGFWGGVDPTTAPIGGWMCNNRINTGDPVNAKGPAASYPASMGNIATAVSFVGGVANVGSNLANLYSVWDSSKWSLSWNNVYSTLAQSLGTFEDVAYYVDKNGYKCVAASGTGPNTVFVAEDSPQTDIAPGTIALTNSVTGTFACNWSSFTDSYIATGAYVSLWPMWRSATGQQSLRCDELGWIIDVFTLLLKYDTTAANVNTWSAGQQQALALWSKAATLNYNLNAFSVVAGAPWNSVPGTNFRVSKPDGTYDTFPSSLATPSRDSSGNLVCSIATSGVTAFSLENTLPTFKLGSGDVVVNISLPSILTFSVGFVVQGTTYTATVTNTQPNTMQALTIPRSSFGSMPQGSVVPDSVFIKFDAGVSSFTLGSVYVVNAVTADLLYPGAVPLQYSTYNSPSYADGSDVGLPYQGPAVVGVQSPIPWLLADNPAKAANMLQLILAAQGAYTRAAGIVGPCAPTFAWNKWDSLGYGEPNTFSFSSPVPDEWMGMQYRTFLNVADYWYRCVSQNIVGAPTQLAYQICSNFMSLVASCCFDFPDSTSIYGQFSGDAPPALVTNPQMVANALSAVIYCRAAGLNNTAVCYKVMKTLYSKLVRLYVPTGSMVGSFSLDPSNEEWFGSWSGEIITAFSLVQQFAPELNEVDSALVNFTYSKMLTDLSGLAAPLPASVDTTWEVIFSKQRNNVASVKWSTVDGTALAGIDYVAASGTATMTTSTTFAFPLTILPIYNFSAKQLSVLVQVDYQDGSSETDTVLLNLVYPNVVAKTKVVKQAFTVPFTDTIPRFLSWETADGTAKAGVDYETTEGGVLIPPGWKTIYAAIPLLSASGSLGKTIDVTFKWFDKTQASTGSGWAQCGGLPRYPVAKSTQTCTISQTMDFDISDVPVGAAYTLANGTAVVDVDFVAQSGTTTGNTLQVVVAPQTPGTSTSFFYMDYTYEGKSYTKKLVLNAGVALTATVQAVPNIDVTTVALDACIPALAFSVPSTEASPKTMPMSVMSAIPTDIHVNNTGSDPTQVMTLTLKGTNCNLQNFGGYFTNYTQVDASTGTITGTAADIAGTVTMMQFQPTTETGAFVLCTLTGGGNTATQTYWMKGGASVIGIENLPTGNAFTLEIVNKSMSITDTTGVLSPTNEDPYIDLTVTVEPDVGGGDLVGITTSAMKRTDSGYGYIVTANTSVLKVVMIPLTVYCGYGTVNTVVAGEHKLTITITDGTNTATYTYTYTLA